jgi:hypothetical protein
MPNHHTRRSTSAQDNSTSYTGYSGSARREGTRRKFQFLARVKASLTSNSGREICEAHKVSHRLAADLANEIARGPYPSLVSSGYVYVGQKALGEALSVHERQVRRAVAVLAALGLLRIERDHRRRRTNLMIPLLDGGPLFGEIGCTACDRATPSSSQGAPVPSAERASAPSDLKGEEERKDSSPVGPSTSEAVSPQAAPMEEEIKTDIGTANGAECPSDSIASPDPKSSPSAAGAAAGSAIEVNFAILMRLYPHPAGQRQQFEAYEPHALTRWHTLTPAEKALSVKAAAMAPGKVWLGHWLDRGRETGNFEVVDRQPAVHRVWVCEGTPQWKAWEDHHRANGQPPPKTQRRIGGEQQTGWMFKTEWPPVVEQAPSPEGVR